MKIIEMIKSSPIIPVVKINDPDNAIPLVVALKEAGINIIEITFRSDAALQSIINIRDKFPDLLIGAGTVLTSFQVDDAMHAGANFIVSPGSDIKLMEYCNSKKIPYIPGCVTPSEIQVALSMNYSLLKFFPAEAYNGLKTLKAIYGPFSQVKFIVTGGVNESNAKEYLDLPNVQSIAGTWMASTNMIDKHQFDEIKEISIKAVKILTY